MRIGVLVWDHRENAQYRSFIPMNELARRGHEVRTAVLERDWRKIPPIAALREFDAVFMWRMHEEPVRRVARELREAGVAVVWDNDDNLPAVPRGAPTYRFHGGMKGQREWAEMRTMIRLVDLVTTPSADLARRYEDVGQTNVRVVENFLPHTCPAAQIGHARREGRVVVGWVANLEHVVDARGLRLAETMRRLIDARPEVLVVTVGVPFELRDPRYQHLRGIPLPQLPAAISQFDVGIAPLIDIPFNRSRSNLKGKEYAAQGVPWLASPVGPYIGLGEQQGGRLVADDEWFEALLAVVDDREGRWKAARRAHEWALGETIERNGWRWEAVVQEAIDRVGAETLTR